jgi:outer membrane receptor protein involved in Fe transport
LEGDADLWGLDLVYRYDGGGAYGHRSFKLQSEYLRSIKDLTVKGGDPDEIGSSRKFTSDGLYVQSWYGIAPRWQVGVRYDVFGITNKVSGGESEDFGSSDRWTAALTWTPTEYSRLRLQYARNDILTEPGHREKFDTLWLQFLVSLGAHGAHKF